MSYFRPDVLFWKPLGENGHAHGPGDQKAKPEPRLPLEFFLQDQDGEKNGQKNAEFIDRDDDAHLSLGDRVVIAKPRTRRGKAG